MSKMSNSDLRRLDTPEHRAFWAFIERAAEEGRRLLAQTHPDFKDANVAVQPLDLDTLAGDIATELDSKVNEHPFADLESVCCERIIKAGLQRVADSLAAPVPGRPQEPNMNRVTSLQEHQFRKILKDVKVWTPQAACAKDSPFEYDQGDVLIVYYDDLYNLVHPTTEAAAPEEPR